MNLESLRRSAIGAAVGAAVFGGVSLYRSLLAEGPLLEFLGPMGMMTVIGATVGGLVGPLLGEAWTRRRAAGEAEDARGSEGAQDGTASDDTVPGRGRESAPGRGKAGGGRQPLWFTLLVGLGVGVGIGTAWGRIWVGVVLGLALALASRRIFP